MDGSQLPTDLEALKKQLLKTQQELASSRQNLASSQQALASSQQQVAELSTTISEQESKLAAKEQQILELIKALRGKQRERIDPAQLFLFELGELEQIIEEELEKQKPARRGKKKHGRRLIPDELPPSWEQETREYTLPESERLCPIDGTPKQVIRFEESKQLDYIPAKIKVIVHRRAVYACPEKHDEAKLVAAPKPPQPIEKGLAASGLLAQVVVSKFGDHLPGYRQEDIFARHGIDIRRSTIYDWMASVADLLLPLHQLMVSRVLSSKVIHTDDTKVKLIDKSLKSTKTARFWAYLGDQRNPYAVYEFTEDRSRDGPTKFLTGFRGYLQADAYSGYDGIYLQSKNSIIEVACWAHCRRYWHKAKESAPEAAHHALALITRLYEVERATADTDSQTRYAARQEHAVPLLEQFGEWLEQQNSFLPKSLIGKARTYTLNQWQALNRYVEDGELSMDNNWAERSMRPIAIGRKNWLFVGSHAAGDRAAVLATVIASCKENLVEPWAYLNDILTRLPYQPTGDDLAALLPDRWLSANPNHRWNIADRRREERKTKA